MNILQHWGDIQMSFQAIAAHTENLFQRKPGLFRWLCLYLTLFAAFALFG
jgi:hypothetical protein